MADISSDAQAVIAAAGAGAQDYILNQGGFGNKLTSGEASRLLTGFSPTITPQQVYSAGNIAQATYNPAPAPNYADPFALREYFMNAPDVVAAREAAKLANQDLLARRQTGRAQQQAIKELPMAMNVIRGSQAVAGEQASLSEQAAAESLLAAQSTYDTLAQEAGAKYDIAKNERAKLQELIASTGGKAGISYGDSFESALRKASDYEDKVAAEKKKTAEKDDLKKLAMSVGISTKGLSSKEIRTKLEKKAKKDSALEDKMNALKLQGAELDIAKAKKSLLGTTDDKSYETQKKALFDDVDRLRTEMSKEKKESGSGITWENAFNTIMTRYPGLTPDEVDELLGVSYRVALEGR